jgi:hypothetical protein
LFNISLLSIKKLLAFSLSLFYQKIPYFPNPTKKPPIGSLSNLNLLKKFALAERKRDVLGDFAPFGGQRKKG